MNEPDLDQTDSRKIFVHENALYLILGFLVLAAVGGFLAYDAFTGPSVETDTVTQNTGTWTTNAEFEHGATVRLNTSVFPEGAFLENRPSYFRSLMPTLEGAYVIEHRGVREPVSGAVHLDIVLRSTEEIDGSQFSHWEDREELASAEFEAIPPGESRRVSFAVNITDLVDRLAAIETELGASPGSSQILIAANARLNGTVNGWRLSDQRNDSLNIQPIGNVYEVSTDVQGQRTEEREESVQIENPVESSPAVRFGGPLLVLIGVIGAGGVAYGRLTGLFEVDESTRERLSFERVRSDHDEWISQGTVPDREPERTVVRLESLDDIVDVAIDTNNRVIEDMETGTYSVLNDSVLYIFRPDWRDDGDDSGEREDSPASTADSEAEE